jgi:CRISPR-associated endoribonuclease Cas6
MLRSLLISLTAESSYPILGGLGRPVQAWFLGQLTRSHASLASRLHDEQGLKPYTVSTLLDERTRPMRAGDWLEPGELCWLRLTSLNEELSDAIEKKIIKHIPRRVTLHKMDFRVDDVFTNRSEHEWAGETSFTEIAENLANPNTDTDHVRVEFVSPTAFRNNGLDVTLPAPGQVFRSLWEKWNTFAPDSMQVQELWPQFANECILVDELTAVNTIRWEFSEGSRGGATGFTGTVGFSLIPKSKVKSVWRDYWDGAATVMQSLAQFAFYAGVGHHTTIGMGQGRQISNFKAEPQRKFTSKQK